MVEFLPLAFGRVLTRDLKVVFADEYVRYSVIDGKAVEKERNKLGAQTVYTHAFHLASEISKKTLFAHLGLSAKYERFQIIAERSAEVKAIKDLIAKGSRPENIVLTEPYFQFRAYE